MKFNNALLQMALLASSASAFTPAAPSFRSNTASAPSASTSTQLFSQNLDSMSMSELQKLTNQNGYDTLGKDRADLIMICKGYPNAVNARPLSVIYELEQTAIRTKAERAERQRLDDMAALQRKQEDDRRRNAEHVAMMKHVDYDTMSVADLKRVVEEKGYNTYQKDRTDLIMICKGYGEAVNATPNQNQQEPVPARSAAGMTESAQEIAKQTRGFPQTNTDTGFFKKHVDYDAMSLHDLRRTVEKQGFKTYQKDRTDLIMILKGYGASVNAQKAQPQQAPPRADSYSSLSSGGGLNTSTNTGFFAKQIDYDMISLDELKGIVNDMGFGTYQKDRTDLIMIAKGYSGAARARPLDEKTRQSEDVARSLPNNGMHMTGRSNFKTPPPASVNPGYPPATAAPPASAFPPPPQAQTQASTGYPPAPAVAQAPLTPAAPAANPFGNASPGASAPPNNSPFGNASWGFCTTK